MNKKTPIAGVTFAIAVLLTGCGLSNTGLSDVTTSVTSPPTDEGATTVLPSTSATTSPSAAATPSTSSTTSAMPTTNAPSSPAVAGSNPTPETKASTSATTTPAPIRPVPTPKPTKPVIPCGMVEVGGNEIGKCPKPVVPAKIIIGETYPWFPVAPGKLAEPWGITGELLFANEFVTVLRTAPQEIVVARDLWNLRGISKYVGVGDPEISFVTGRHPFQPNCGGGCTVVYLSCHSSGEIMGGSATKHYKITNALPAVLKVRYIEVINISDFGCD